MNINTISQFCSFETRNIRFGFDKRQSFKLEQFDMTLAKKSDCSIVDLARGVAAAANLGKSDLLNMFQTRLINKLNKMHCDLFEVNKHKNELNSIRDILEINSKDKQINQSLLNAFIGACCRVNDIKQDSNW